MVWSGNVGAEELALFPQIKAMGYDGVEIPIFAPEAIDVPKVKTALAASGLVCTTSTAMAGGLSLIDADVQADSIEWLQSVVQVAAALGSTVLCGPMPVPVGELRGRGYTQAEWDTCVQSLRAVGNVAESEGVSLALEPLNRFETFMFNTTDDGIRLCEEVDSPAVGLLLDTFHMHMEEKSTTDAIRRAGHHIKHFHCSENDRGTVGTGQVPWTGVFQALDDIDYHDWLVVESFNAVIPELAGATCIWRPLAESPYALAQDSLRFIEQAM